MRLLRHNFSWQFGCKDKNIISIYHYDLSINFLIIFSMRRRIIDLQRLRRDHKITQQRLALLTKYPQSYISQIENGRVDANDRFLTTLAEVLGIKDLEPYFSPSPEEKSMQQANNPSDLQGTINRLLDMLDRRDERIRELETENKRLTDILLNNK